MVKFYKMQSLGNDFMVLDAISCGDPLPTEKIKQWGLRNEGVGFDQLLVIAPPNRPDADFQYLIYNADGSESEQCGNGTRCVAWLVRHLGLSNKSRLTWHSKGGVIHTRLLEERNPMMIETTLPAPSLDASTVPFVANTTTNTAVLEVDNRDFKVTAVSTGNPHGVVFVDNIATVDVATIGAQLSIHSAFPNHANIGFCQVVDRSFVRLRVYERGVGETRACGTGASAAVVAAHSQSLVDTQVKVSLPGGKLRIRWSGPNQPITMSGEATLVFEGEINLKE
ncbi:MAG: diaminopimelate epimerase [Gammaproteobacteria bacterium]|nr:diaminopimelate epimerase [Gammaproteobacteria bacterium]